MAILHISEDVEARLESAARRAGRTPEDLAEEILSTNLADHSLSVSALSFEQLERLKESMAQAQRGELIPSKKIDQFFEEWFAELRAR